MREALEFSNAMAALNCTALGARGGISGLEEIRALMARAERRPRPGLRALIDKPAKCSLYAIPSRATRSLWSRSLIIAVNLLVFLFEASLDPYTLNAFIAQYGLGPGPVSSFGHLHLDVPARRLDARAGQHVVPVDLRRQHRRHSGPREVSGVLPDVRGGGGADADVSQRRFARSHGGRQRRHRGRDGRVPGEVSALAHRDAGLHSSSSFSSTCRRGSC